MPGATGHDGGQLRRLGPCTMPSWNCATAQALSPTRPCGPPICTLGGETYGPGKTRRRLAASLRRILAAAGDPAAVTVLTARPARLPLARARFP